MSQIRRYIFPAYNRIKNRQDFLNARNRGSRYRTHHFIVYLLPNGTEESRLGVTVSRKIGNSVVRNRIKRLLREYFRLNIENIPSGIDVSIIVRRNLHKAILSGVSEELKVIERRDSGPGIS